MRNGQRPDGAFWLTLAAMAALWGVVIYRIGPPFWSTFPDYSFGWGVPFLCLYLLWERWKSRGAGLSAAEEERGARAALALRRAAWGAGLLLALSLLPSFLVQEANLIWLRMGWIVTLQALGLTVCLLFLAGGWGWVRHFWFPFFFFLTAIHWGPVEAPLIALFSRLNAATAIEALGMWGIPAVQHGNVLEVSTGLVGIDEACSGIRSFHAVLMIALFFGELYRLGAGRRGLLVLAGVLLAFACNVGRTLTLTVVCARQGMAAMERWHDPTGVSILVACFLGLWWLSLAMARRRRPTAPVQAGTTRLAPSLSRPFPSLPRGWSIGLILWLASVEVMVNAWYRLHEMPRQETAAWSVTMPADQRGFREVGISKSVAENLKFDEGRSARWEADDGGTWHAYYFRWAPPETRSRRAWVQRATGHHPERCLTGAGMRLVADRGMRLLPHRGLTLPFRVFEFEAQGRLVHVFQCIWHDGTPPQLRQNARETATTIPRLTAVLTGNRSRGRGLRSLELAAWGHRDLPAAEASLREQLDRLMMVHK
ncbi:MAG: exosortase/archaeosortase family protein [Verrucomicrobia bacterium]|nr:exosortase/archaeosortase family protein [Verrucomicrobiota bacterium]